MSEIVTSKGASKTCLAAAHGTEANLDVVLKMAIEALTSLDAECLEVLSRELEISAGSISVPELQRARAAHLVLGCLLQQTCRNLELFERIQERSFDKYPNPPRITL